MKKRILISVLINILLAYFVYAGINFPYIPFLWIISIFVLVIPFTRDVKIKKVIKSFSKEIKENQKEIFAVLALCLILIFVVIVNYDPERFHQDDLITAFFSIKHNFSGLLFFNPVPINPTDWVCQFPSTFFVIQQVIFGLLGTTNLTVKLSVIPFNIIILVFLYLILKQIFNKKIAFAGSFFYIFLGISLYFTTLGLHFISSTAIYTVSMYFVVKYFKKPSVNLAVCLGICAAFSMLFYVSSYLVPFFILGIIFLKIFTKKRKIVLRDMTIVLLLFFSILLPFITYCYKSNNWYFLQRIDQVKLIDGEWSQNKTQGPNTSVNAVETYLKNFDLSFRSLYTDGIGGQGGYNTSKLAFFDGFTAIFLLISVILIIRDYKKNFMIIYFLLTIIATFIAGMVMTIPPPPFHRMTLILPAFAVVFSYPLKLINEKVKGKNLLHGIFFVVILGFAVVNLIHARESIKTEIVNPQIPILNYIKDNLPNRNLYMASYPSFALGKFCSFYENCYSKNLVIDSSENILLQAEKIKKEDAIVYVLFYSNLKDEFDKSFPGYNVVEFGSDQAILSK